MSQGAPPRSAVSAFQRRRPLNAPRSNPSGGSLPVLSRCAVCRLLGGPLRCNASVLFSPPTSILTTRLAVCGDGAAPVRSAGHTPNGVETGAEAARRRHRGTRTLRRRGAPGIVAWVRVLARTILPPRRFCGRECRRANKTRPPRSWGGVCWGHRADLRAEQRCVLCCLSTQRAPGE